MFQNRIFRELWGEKKKDSTKFILKQRKKNHKTPAEEENGGKRIEDRSRE